jgi:hypothetical protein
MSIPNLFRSLKAESAASSGSVSSAGSNLSAAANAEKHWPLLKSISPKKWQATPKIEEDAKQQRRLHSADPSKLNANAGEKSIAPQRLMIFGSEINRELAVGLTRMLSRKAPPVSIAATRPIPLTTLTPTALTPAPLPAAVPLSSAAPQRVQPNDDSLAAVIRRVENANAPRSQIGVKPAGFLSRLGRR